MFSNKDLVQPFSDDSMLDRKEGLSVAGIRRGCRVFNKKKHTNKRPRTIFKNKIEIINEDWDDFRYK